VARQARAQGQDVARMTDLAIYVLIGGLVGAKVLLLVVDFKDFVKEPRELWSIVRSGGVFYGGLLGGIGVAAWYTIKHKLEPWRVMDVLAPGVALGQAIGRFACLAAGCCYGRPTEVPWAVIYRNIEAYRTVGTPMDTPVHPTQVYESIACIAIFALLVFWAPRKRFHGQITLAYVVLYAVVRFAIEYFRGDVARGFVFGGLFSTSPFISLGMLLAALAVTPYLMKKQRVLPVAG
jgi:phosphatidylglycerol:prolipoprotein diacylglycerol transferase